jgi:hypothetical protein
MGRRFWIVQMKGQALAQGEDNSKWVKIHWKFLKIFSRTSRPISIKLSINHPWVKGILNCSKKGPDSLQRGDNHKHGMKSSKNLLNNHWAKITHIYIKPFWYNVDSELLTSWSPWVGRGHNRENHIYIQCMFILKKNLHHNQKANFNQTLYKSSFGKGDSKLFKWKASTSLKGR